jgi:hypothetical protein
MTRQRFNLFSRDADSNPFVAAGLAVRLLDYRNRIDAAGDDVIALDVIRGELFADLDPVVRGFHGFEGRARLRELQGEVLNRIAAPLETRTLPAVTTWI